MQFNIDIHAYSNELECAVASLVLWDKIIELQEPDIVYRVESGASDLFDFLSINTAEGRIANPIGSPADKRMAQQADAIAAPD